METFEIECNDPSDLEGLAGDPDLARFERLSLWLRWWQPLAPLAALLHASPFRALSSFSLSLSARLPPEAFASICVPDAPSLHELELDLPVDDTALGALVRDARLGGLRRLMLRRAEFGPPGLRAFVDSGLPSQLDEFGALGRSLGPDEVRTLLGAGFPPGAALVLDVHGPPEERLALKQEAEARGLKPVLFEHDAPKALWFWQPIEWLEPSDSLSLDLDDPWRRRMFVEMPYEHPATIVDLRMRDPGALAGLDWGYHYPRLESLNIASSERVPLSAGDLVAISYWRLPTTLRQLEVRNHRWGWYEQFAMSYTAAQAIVRQLDRPPGSTVSFSPLPDSMNPGSCDNIYREIQRPHCKVYFRR
jgi:hypothetical protein